MFRPVHLFALALTPALLFGGTLQSGATGQLVPCGDRAKLAAALKNKYQEVPVALGVSQKNTEAFEIFASAKGTWSLVMTTSTGKTCIMAVGHSWTEIEAVSTDPET